MSRGLRIDTTFNVELNYNKANLGRRIGAFVIDYLIKIGFLLFVVWLIFEVFPNVGDTAQLFLFMLFTPVVFYSLLFEYFMNGQTPGKKALDLKVISLDGRPASIGQYLLRWLFLFVDILMSQGVIAILCAALSEKGQRLGDMVAGTTVIDMNSRRRNRIETEIEKDYIPKYEEAANLSPKEIAVIKKVLNTQTENRFQLVKELAMKVEEKLFLTKEESSREFLQKISKDYQYYTFKRSKFDIEEGD